MLTRTRTRWRKIFGRGIDGRSVFSLSKEITKGQTSEFQINLALQFIVKSNIRQHYKGRVIRSSKHRGICFVLSVCRPGVVSLFPEEARFCQLQNQCQCLQLCRAEDQGSSGELWVIRRDGWGHVKEIKRQTLNYKINAGEQKCTNTKASGTKGEGLANGGKWLTNGDRAYKWQGKQGRRVW